jgi:hypothetical protein
VWDSDLLTQARLSAPQQTALADAIGYTRNQWTALWAYHLRSDSAPQRVG